MSLVFKDELFDAQWLRAISHAGSGGAEPGECFAVARRIREPDPEGWYSAWFEAATVLLAAAEQSLAKGHQTSARDAFLRASNYFRAAYTFLIGQPVDPRVRDGYRRQREAFAAAAALMQPTAGRVAIPYEKTCLHGYFFPAAGSGPHPVLIINGGYDSTAEEAYFFSGAAALARGYHVLVFDGPGQGQAIIEDGLVFRPDWENVITPVVDFLLSRADVDPGRIALLGISFGGYLAPRAACTEHRLAALIADPGEFSLLEEMQSRLPAFIARELPEGKPWVLSLLNRLLCRRLRHPTAGWGLRRGLWVHGLGNPLDYLRLTADYTLAGRAAQIRCPTLVCRAENDDIGVTASRLYDSLTCEKTFMTFTAAEGAGEHCEAGARALFNQRALDWLDATLAR